MGTFDRNVAIRDSQAEFFAIGHPFVDAMLQHIGDYDFGGHTALRVIEVQGNPAPKVGYQFNFTIRSRVAREDGDEHLFSLHTVVVLADGHADEKSAEIAASSFSVGEDPTTRVSNATRLFESLDLQQAYELAKAHLGKSVPLWDWEEDVDLIGVARLVAVNPGS